MDQFDPKTLKNLYQPGVNSSGEDNGQIVIIGGSSLFHGAPLLSLKTAARVVDMVFFASPEEPLKEVSQRIKSELLSFVWVPWPEVEEYIEKADAVLIGPGFLRFTSEKVPHHQRHHVCDEACQITKKISEELLKKFPQKKWVIDAGSLQTIAVDDIPQGSILTPNKKEFELLFGQMSVTEAAKKSNCTIVLKGPTTVVASPEKYVEVNGGNPGLTKGGTGDVQAGLTVALLAKNDPFFAACAAAYVVKKAADTLFEKVGTYFSAEDLADKIPEVLASL